MTYSAFSWNYVSVGMDAKAAHGFHELRENKPGLAFSRAANQFWYGWFSCTSGWFCGSGPLNEDIRLEAIQDDGSWKEVPVPASVRAVIFLNLQVLPSTCAFPCLRVEGKAPGTCLRAQWTALCHPRDGERWQAAMEAATPAADTQAAMEATYLWRVHAAWLWFLECSPPRQIARGRAPGDDVVRRHAELRRRARPVEARRLCHQGWLLVCSPLTCSGTGQA